MKILRTAVIGLGRVAYSFHIPQIIEHDGFELVGVVDPLKERFEEAESEFGVKGYADCESLLNAEKPDLVVIASPTQFHCEQAIIAFEHGCDVFCDKPFARLLSEADSMIASMNKHGRKLMLYQPHRVKVEVAALLDILGRGLIGKVYMMKRACSQYERRNDWQAFKEHGGGMLNNFGAHFIDQLLYLAGAGVKRINCSLRTIASLGDADDVVKAVIETENGPILDLDINMAAGQEFRPWQILGKYGSITLDKEERAWKVRFFRPDELEDVGVQEGLAAKGRVYGSGETIPWQEATFRLLDYQPINFYQKCYEYFAMDGEPFVPVAHSREIMRVIDVCRKSAEMENCGNNLLSSV